jgi:methionyl-tRNA formyltransferase
LEKEDGRIDWSVDAETVRNLIRGTNPFPGAFTIWQGQSLKVHRAAVVDGSGEPGVVIEADGKAGPVVATGKGALALAEVQPPGKKRMSGTDFVRGYPIGVDDRLGNGAGEGA